ncbi:MAG: hypothetical protein JNJ59_27700, partial [Deltaproteobacteria bacterium]|nr:hypothetical protein [Deltaproteobacteria bacterium]
MSADAPRAMACLWVCFGVVLTLGVGCASGGARLGRMGRIPPLLGASRVEVSAASGPDVLAERSAAERESGRLAAAERYARWALALSPEHVGGLVAAARVAGDAGDREGARSLWALAADRGPAVARAIDAERGAVLLALAQAELAAGRVERAESLWRELETETPQFAAAQRKARLELAMALADTWLARALPAAGRETVAAAERLGANAAWVKLRRLELELLGGEPVGGAAAGDVKASPEGTGAPRAAKASEGLTGSAMEARALAELGRDGERWQALARWLLAIGRLEDAALAAQKSIAGDDADPRSWEVAAEIALARDLAADAVTAWTQAARRKKTGGAEVAWAGAVRLAEEGKLEEARALEALVRELAPGSAAAVRAAVAEGARTLGPGRSAQGSRAGAEDKAQAILEATARAAPSAWAQLIAAPNQALDRKRVAAILRAARETGLSSWAAALAEAEAWREVRDDPEVAQREADKAFEAALAGVGAGEVVRLLEAGRVAFTVGLPGWAERVGAAAAGGPAAAYVAAMRERGDPEKARRTLEGKGAMAAFVRAHALLDGRLGADSWRAARDEVERARVQAAVEDGGPTPDELATYALRVALRGGASEAKRLERAASAWFATRDVGDAGWNAVLTPGWLLSLRASSGLSADLQLAVRDAILATPALEGLYERVAVEQERAALLLSEGRLASLYATWTEELARLEPGATTRRGLSAWIEATGAGTRPLTHAALVEKAIEKALSRSPSDAVNFFVGRLHPEELRQFDLVAKLVEIFEGRGERARVRRLVEATLGRVQAAQVQAPRVLGLATQLLELGYPDLASRGFEQVLAAGDRSSQAWVGAVRAALRMADRGILPPGGDAGARGAADADALVNRWLDARERRDARSVDEAARLLTEEGRLGRAIDLMTGRLLGEDGAPRNDVGVLQPLAEALRRAGKTEGLIAVAQRLANADPRGASRAQALAAQRLIEAGALEAARDIIAKGLETRPRDTQLLSVGVMVSLGLRQDARPLASAMVREAGSSWDVWDRVVGDLRNAGQVEAALGVLGEGLERYPGSPRLLAARARVHLFMGQPDAAAADFAEALARATTAREVIDLAEPLYKQAIRPELLADLLGRAAAISPGRADIATQLGRWLIEADRPDEAQLVFGRLTSDSDRASASLAAAWGQGGYLGPALDQWQRAFDPGPVAELVQTFDAVSRALVKRGEPERLESFVRLYLQAVRGAAGPPLYPVAKAYRDLGRREDALRWLERAERETPVADLSLELVRARLEAGEDDLALAAAERAIARRINASGFGRMGDSAVAAALEPIMSELIGGGRAALAREFARRVAVTF